MAQKLFHGLRKHWLVFPILLLILLLFKRAKANPANVPTAISQSVNQALSQSPYSNYIPFWLAISKMETAAWTSRLFTQANNLWGMKLPRQRDTTANGVFGTGPFAKYMDVDDAAADIRLWMIARQFPTGITNLDDFVAEMGRKGYFGTESTESYLSKVKAWLKR